MDDVTVIIDELLAEFLTAIRPHIADTILAAYQRGQDDSSSRYSHTIAEVTRALGELSNMNAALTQKIDKIKIVGDSGRAAERAAQGTVKPRIFDLISRPSGASVSEIEGLGVKHNSIRGTLYALHREGKIERRGDRWYRVPQQRNEAPAESAGAS